MILPPKKDPAMRAHFLPIQNNMAEDEIEAHTGMFEPGTNDSYYQLGLEVAKVIREYLAISRGITEG